MSKASFEIVKNDDRLFFNDGEQYVLLDTGFITAPVAGRKNSASVNGRIGPFSVNCIPEGFLNRFINMKMEDGSGVTAVLNPMDGYNCQLKGSILTVSDEDMELSDYDCFFEFVSDRFALLDGSISNQKCRFLFDSGARMTMFGEEILAASEPVRTYREWLAMKFRYADLPVYKLNLEFPNGFKYTGEGTLVKDADYAVCAEMMGFRAILGIDIFNHYDMSIIAKGAKRGVALHRK